MRGEPTLRAGSKLKIKGLGPQFSGSYRVSSTTHVYGGGYETTFEVLGRSPRDLLDLARPATKNVWGDSLVVGIVTNNKDPDGLGRVRVKYPEPRRKRERGRLGAGGRRRGRRGPRPMMMPQVGDEVLVGFEGGNAHGRTCWVRSGTARTSRSRAPEPTGARRPTAPTCSRSPKLIDMAAADK